jgi:hypothetical protein
MYIQCSRLVFKILPTASLHHDRALLHHNVV